MSRFLRNPFHARPLGMIRPKGSPLTENASSTQRLIHAIQDVGKEVQLTKKNAVQAFPVGVKKVFAQKLGAINYDALYQVVRWVLPAAIVPTIRHTFIDPKDKRDTYLVRDLTNFVMGALVFWGTKKIAFPILKQLQWVSVALPSRTTLSREAYQKALSQAEDFMAYAIAVTAQVLNNGVAAVKISRWFEARTTRHAVSPSVPTPRILSPASPIGVPAMVVHPSPVPPPLHTPSLLMPHGSQLSTKPLIPPFSLEASSSITPKPSNHPIPSVTPQAPHTGLSSQHP
ncbi:MAG: hypothetical protein ACKO37_09395 [Vampirovibrionales bacterium]